MPPSTDPVPAPLLPTAEALKAFAGVLKAQLKAVETVRKAAAKPDKLAKALQSLQTSGEVDIPALRLKVSTWLAAEKDGRRERFAVALRARCEAEGIELLKLTQDPLELRLPPVSARIDFEANRVEILYSQQVVGTCAAEADAVLAARRCAVTALEGVTPWDADAFHALLRRAWLRASPNGDWVEIGEVLPEVALLRQPKAFRQDPRADRYVAYSRAQLAYDLWRLRRDRALTRSGWRLSVAPATGTSTKDKKLVYWLEDDRGQGQFHLTLRFLREESHVTS